jgi:dTDP-4-dehydrorhamnose reductase
LIDLNRKVLISGASGMLGSALRAELSKQENVDIYYISHSGHVINNFKNRVTVDELFGHQFYAFFHCAAEINVNLCETDYNQAIRSNVEYTRELFEKVKASKYFYISTDSVYQGVQGNYKESDEVMPVNNYALSKLLGETIALESSSNVFVIRTNIFGLSSKTKSSLFEWAKGELEQGKSINGYTNVFFNPLSVNHLACILWEMADRPIDFGVYNIGSSSYLSKYDFLVKVAKYIGISREMVCPTMYEIIDGLAPRPLNTTLNCSKICEQMEGIDLTIEKSFKDLKIAE